MTLKEKINQDFKKVFKNKEEAKISVLRLLNAAIKTREVEKRTKLSKAETDLEKLEKESQLSDEEVLAVVSSEAKRRREAIEQYQKGGRPELAAQEEAELKILSAYLPEQLSEGEIRKLVKEAIQKSGAANVQELGKVMAILMPRLKGRAEGGAVQKIVKEEFEK